jgi:hypothetical protein
MQQGERVAIWIHDEAARPLLGLVYADWPKSRWAAIGVVDSPVGEVPIGI